jgi:peptide deformylase
MVRKIITYPNTILRKKSKNVENFDAKLHKLLDDMNETMMEKGGVGLAAIQVGVPLNVLIINIPVEKKDDQNHDKQLPENLIEAVNPVITYNDGEFLFNEGCLSVPGFNADIKRSKYITVKFFNRSGEQQIMECEDFLAVAWQHELEHLNGHLFVENLSFLKRKKFEKDWKKELKEKSKNREK